MDFAGVTFCKQALENQKLNIAELIAINDTIDDAKLRHFYKENGYLFVRNLIPRSLVMSARQEILQKYAIIGEVDDRHPINLGIESKRSYRKHVNIRALRQSIISGYYYQSVSQYIRVQHIVNRIMKHESEMLRYLWPRLASVGSGTALHQDAPFLKGAPSNALVSVWTPLGDITPKEGALVILNGSHKSKLLQREYGNKDVDKENNFGWYNTDLYECQQKIGGQCLTTNFQAGDVLIFNLMTLHGAFDNNSENKIRLSSDSRYQSTKYPIHSRWQGNIPVGRSESRIFLPQSTTLDTLSNQNLNSEFHDIDDFGKIKNIE